MENILRQSQVAEQRGGGRDNTEVVAADLDRENAVEEGENAVEEGENAVEEGEKTLVAKLVREV